MTAPLGHSADQPLDELLAWDFSDRLRKIRKRVAGLGQREFAAEIGVGWQAYAQWEAGNNMPKNLIAVAKRIELLTGVPAAWVLGVDMPAQASGSRVTIGETIRYLFPSMSPGDSASSQVSAPHGNYHAGTGDAVLLDLDAARLARRNPGQPGGGGLVARCSG